ncbi:two-component system sensor histidine kinase NtrB [Paenibacillus aestuarii]|uniref:histidine kinase n=1 Tax=Paenibacillus aestuarii TaxID=516965 RepID=A0ABW0K6H3_9BACL|nr:ATP-binding protein [Paenibacillus aestuarii]
MFFRLMYHVVLPLYVGFILLSTISLGKDLNHVLLIIAGVTFIGSILIEPKFPRYLALFSTLQVTLLVFLHWFSQLNWCYSLYIILLSKLLFQHTLKVMKATFLGFVVITLYTMIRLSYTPSHLSSFFAIASDFLTSLAVVLIIQYIVEMEQQKNRLKEEKLRDEMRFENEKMKLLGELAAGLAHEIRNPLAIIQGFLQHSKTRSFNIEPWYELIYGEVERMNSLTVEFLQFAKPNPSAFDLIQVHHCLEKVRLLTETKSIHLGHRMIYTEFNENLFCRMDLDKMLQVLVNMINNALEAMDNKGTVTVKLSKDTQDAVIEIQDTGRGIHDKDLQDIFHPFFTTKTNGTGLGLSICQKIVQDHGGTIQVKSKLQQGTTFTIRLPLGDVA